MPVKSNTSEFGELLRSQLKSKPVRNEAIVATPLSGNRLKLTIPLRYSWWATPLRRTLHMRSEKYIELDPLGAEIFSLFDGRRTLEEIIDLHSDRWKLTFFESRAMILEFLRRLARRKLIFVLLPEEREK